MRVGGFELWKCPLLETSTNTSRTTRLLAINYKFQLNRNIVNNDICERPQNSECSQKRDLDAFKGTFFFG